jgi:hypothetical protein
MNKSNYGPGTKALLDPTNALWNLAMTFKTSGLFLLNTLWQFLLSKVRLSALYSLPVFTPPDNMLSTSSFFGNRKLYSTKTWTNLDE